MHVARRVYLYLVAFISLMMLLTGATNLLRLLAEIAFDLPRPFSSTEHYARDQFSLWGAVLLVSTAVWSIHWLLIRRTVAADQSGAERRTVWRKLFLYAVLFVSSWLIFFATFDLVRALTGGGGDLRSRRMLSDAAPALLVYGLAWFYHWITRRDDLAHAPETGAGATVARWYVYLVTYGGLSGLLWGLSELARQLWRAITASDGTTILLGAGLPARLQDALGFIVAGLLVWLPHWALAQHQLATEEAERRSVLRKVYLYALIGQTVGVTLTNLAFFGYSLLRMLIGTDPLGGSGDTLLTAAGLPLLTALVYGTFWAYHRRVLGRDSLLLATEEGQQATIRRIYTYLLALIGLALLASGLADMVRLLIDLALGGRATTDLSGRAWGDQISLFATGVVVGGLVWAAHWVAAQRAALAAGGEAERQALIRRIYLFLTLFAGVVTLLVSGAILLYRLLRSLGIGLSGDDRSDLSWALGAAIAAGGTVAYHLRVLLDDQRQRVGEAVAAPVAAPSAAPSATRLILLRDATPDELEAAIAGLRAALPEAATIETLAAEGVTADDLRAWLAGQVRARPGDAAVGATRVAPTAATT
jgi:hypothetical protein